MIACGDTSGPVSPFATIGRAPVFDCAISPPRTEDCLFAGRGQNAPVKRFLHERIGPMRKDRLFGALPAAALLAIVTLSTARAEQPYGAVVVYGAPLESGGRPGASFIAASQADVLDLAVEQCKANTVTEQWGNCIFGRWINTGRSLLVAVACEATDAEAQHHRLLDYTKDGTTANDEELRQAVQRVTPYTIPYGGCRKVAVFDATRPELSNQEEPGIARSVAKDPAVKDSVSKDAVAKSPAR